MFGCLPIELRGQMADLWDLSWLIEPTLGITTSYQVVDTKAEILEELRAHGARIRREITAQSGRASSYETEAVNFKQRGDKQRGLTSMRRKKMCEQTIENLEAAEFNVETMALAVESGEITGETHRLTLKAHEYLKKSAPELSLDKIRESMAKMEEELRRGSEAQDETSKPLVDTGGSVDEEELLKEYESLGTQPVQTKVTNVSQTVSQTKTRTIPVTPLPKTKKGVDEELKDLEKELLSVK